MPLHTGYVKTRKVIYRLQSRALEQWQVLFEKHPSNLLAGLIGHYYYCTVDSQYFQLENIYADITVIKAGGPPSIATRFHKNGKDILLIPIKVPVDDTTYKWIWMVYTKISAM